MIRFIVSMAWRETRGAWRHFLYFFVCIAVGVGALVGVSLFAVHVDRAVTKEARGLLGGDLEIRSSHPLSAEGQDVLHSLAQRGIAVTHVSELVAMAARTERETTAVACELRVVSRQRGEDHGIAPPLLPHGTSRRLQVAIALSA